LSKLVWIVAVINTAAAIILAAVRYNSPSGSFWTLHPYWVLAAVVTTLSVPLAHAAVIEMGERGRRKVLERQDQVEAFLTASLIDLERHAGADLKTTGVQAFVVRGFWKWERQVRLAKVRLAPTASSAIRWTKDKGIIGRCWVSHAPQFEDLETYFAPYRNYDQPAWNRLTPALRYGLSYEDFQRLNGKYGIVASVPIVNSKDKYIGCIAADTPPRAGTPPTLIKAEVLNTLSQTARLVQAVL
jgi:hypothetical protein